MEITSRVCQCFGSSFAVAYYFGNFFLNQRYLDNKKEEYTNQIKIEDITYDELDKNNNGIPDTLIVSAVISSKVDKNGYFNVWTSCYHVSPRIVTNAAQSYVKGNNAFILRRGSHSYQKEISFTESETYNPQLYAHIEKPIIYIHLAMQDAPGVFIEKEKKTGIDPLGYEREKVSASSCTMDIPKSEK